jgi:hypothetical protein
MPEDGSLYQALLGISRRAFDAAQVEVAYHALAAAAHAAEDEERTDRLEQVEQVARDDLGWLDAHRPEHRFASPAAAQRGHASIFDQLVTIAAGMRMRIGIDRRRVEAQAQARGAG